MQDSGSENDASISLDRASDAPQDGAEYINCILTLDNFAMPTLQYVMGDEDPIAAGTAYSYGLRTVTSTTDDAGVTTLHGQLSQSPDDHTRGGTQEIRHREGGGAHQERNL